MAFITFNSTSDDLEGFAAMECEAVTRFTYASLSRFEAYAILVLRSKTSTKVRPSQKTKTAKLRGTRKRGKFGPSCMCYTDPSDGQRHEEPRQGHEGRTHRATFYPRHRQPLNHHGTKQRLHSGGQVRRLNTNVSASGDLKSIGSIQISLKRFLNAGDNSCFPKSLPGSWSRRAGSLEQPEPCHLRACNWLLRKQ